MARCILRDPGLVSKDIGYLAILCNHPLYFTQIKEAPHSFINVRAADVSFWNLHAWADASSGLNVQPQEFCHKFQKK